MFNNTFLAESEEAMDKHYFKTFPEDKVYHRKIKYSAGSGVLVVSEAAPGTHNVPTNGPGIGNRNVAAELVFSKLDIDADILIFPGGEFKRCSIVRPLV